jgi:hypothetical protein
MRKIKAESEVNLPTSFLNSLDTILNQFGDDLVRFKQYNGEVEYTTCMDHLHLRESIKSICKKYARKTAKEFIVLGTICHSHDTQEPNINMISGGESLQTHLVGMAENLYELEQVFGSKGKKEVIIEPIAIYTEL